MELTDISTAKAVIETLGSAFALVAMLYKGVCVIAEKVSSKNGIGLTSSLL